MRGKLLESLFCQAYLCRFLDLKELLLCELSLFVKGKDELAEELFLVDAPIAGPLEVLASILQETVEFLVTRLI